MTLDLNSIIDQVPDQPQVTTKKNSLDSAFDALPDGPVKPVDKPVETVAPAPEPKKFPDVMSPDTSQKQDAIKPDMNLAPASKWKFNLDYSKRDDNVASGTSEIIAAAGGRFDKSLAAMFNQMDFVQTSLGDALNQIILGKKAAVGIQEMRNKYGVHLDDIGGQPNINTIRPFKAISDAINMAAGNIQLPNTIGGAVIGGIADIGPQLLATPFAPEIAAGKIMSKLGIDYFSKFGLVMGAQGLVQSAQDNQNSSDAQKLTTPIIKGIEQYATGVVYDMFGEMSAKVGGRLAEKLIPEFKDAAKAGEKYAHEDIKLTPDQGVNKMLVNSLGTTAANAAVIGGYGNLVEFLENGDTSWKTFATGAGMGLAMGGKEVGKLMMAKGFNSLVSADPGMIERSINSPVSSEELISMAQDKFKSISDGTSKNPEGDAAAGLLATRAAVLKGVLEEVQTNPTELLKTIEESTMPPEAKTKITESLNQIIANSDQAVVEARPINDKIAKIDEQIKMYKENSNLAPADQEFKIKSLAAKREGLFNKVISIHEKYAKTKTPAEEKAAQDKLVEDTKQANIIQSKAAVVFPQFQEQGKAVAEEYGGTFESRLKTPSSITGKTTRQGSDVSGVEDVMGGAIVLPDMKNFKEVSKKLKDDGYTISNKRLPNKEIGWRGVTATKVVDGVSQEIQLHTDATWKAHQEALKLTNPYRSGIPAEPEIKTSVALGERKPVTDAEKRIMDIKGEDAFTVPITKEGKDIGSATVENTEDGWRIKWIDTNGARMEDSKTRGTGRDAMKLLNEEARKEGKVVISDIPGKTSDQAAKAWDKLVASGDAEKVGEGWRFKTKETQQELYDNAMQQSRSLYNEAYKPLEETNLVGSPAKTIAQRKMKELGIPISQQKELNKAWTEMKGKIVGELKDKNIETKQAFKDFIKNMPPISDLSIKLQKRMLNKVNSIDFTKPASLNKAIKYFDNIVNNATFRLHEIESEKALTTLDEKSSEASMTKKMANAPDKNIKGPSGLPLWDEMKAIRKDMIERDWSEGQAKIQDIYDKATEENRPLTADEFNQVTRLNLWGALNTTNLGDHNYLKGAARDLLDIRKKGSSEAAAARMFDHERTQGFLKDSFDVLTGNGKKPVELDPKHTANLKDSAWKKIRGAIFDWPMSSSFFSHLDFLSQHDKTSKPYDSYLSRTLGESQWVANRQTYTDRKDLFNEIENKTSEIFGTAKGRKMQNESKNRTSEIHNIKYKDLMGTERELPITMNQAVKVYMELQDPSLEKSNEAGGYMRDGELTDLGKGVMDLLTPEAKAWGDWQLNEFYPKIYDFLNPAYRQFYGRDMPFNATYSPIFVEGVENKSMSNDDLLARQSFTAGVKNGSLLARTKHAKPLRLMDADQVLMSYVHNMTYWKNYTEPVQLLSAFTHDPNIRQAIKQNFTNGDTHLRVLQKTIDDMTKKPTDSWMTAGVLRKVRNNFLVASLALKFPVGLKQLSSVPAFLEYMPMSEVPKYAIESLVHWAGDKGNVALAKKLWNDAYLQQRYGQGWDNVLTEIMATDYHNIGGKSDWRNKAMFPVMGGDAMSVMVGGIPVYRYAYDQAMKKYGPGSERLAEAEALETFTRAVDDTQQSGLDVNLSQIQTSNDFYKAMTMYKSANMQYQRKVSAAVRGLIHGRGTWQQNVKTVALYHVVMPMLFQFMANGFKWNNRDEVQAGLLGNINDLFVAGDMIDGIINTVNGQPWKKYQVSPLLATYEDAVNTATHLSKVKPSASKMAEGVPEKYLPQVLKAAHDMEPNYAELLKAGSYAGKFMGNVLGLPVDGTVAVYKGIKDVAEGNVEPRDKFLRIIGFSKYNAGNAVDGSDMTPEQIQKLIEEAQKKYPTKTSTSNKPAVKTQKVPNF
jgi:hypothetical protein